jgi:hypothetical protein
VAISESDVWGQIGLTTVAAAALYAETGLWDGLAVPVFLFLVFAAANYDPPPAD